MALTTLTNISVPTGGAGTNSGLLMPKLTYRFRVLFDGFGSTDQGDGTQELTRQIVDVTRPTVSFEQMTIDAYNSRTYLAGKHTWEPITITIREDMESRVQKMVGEQLQKQFDFYEQSSAISGGVYKFSTIIEILDGGNGNNMSATDTGNVLDQYRLVGCYLENVAYNQLAYSTSDQVNITLTIRYDNAIQYGPGAATVTGIGSNIGRADETSPGGTQVTG
jgi:hypothetical protein